MSRIPSLPLLPALPAGKVSDNSSKANRQAVFTWFQRMPCPGRKDHTVHTGTEASRSFPALSCLSHIFACTHTCTHYRALLGLSLFLSHCVSVTHTHTPVLGPGQPSVIRHSPFPRRLLTAPQSVPTHPQPQGHSPSMLPTPEQSPTERGSRPLQAGRELGFSGSRLLVHVPASGLGGSSPGPDGSAQASCARGPQPCARYRSPHCPEVARRQQELKQRCSEAALLPARLCRSLPAPRPPRPEGGGRRGAVAMVPGAPVSPRSAPCTLRPAGQGRPPPPV